MKARNQLILDVNGVGYNLYALPSLLTAAAPGETIELHISESIREDAHDLYGFLSLSERDTFELLRKVSGVGPKAALGMLSFYPPQEIMTLIEGHDSTKLSLVPGIGKKMAEKIIVELKGKVQVSIVAAPEQNETIAALESLGYNRHEIAAALPKVPSHITNSTDQITRILRHLGE